MDKDFKSINSMYLSQPFADDKDENGQIAECRIQAIMGVLIGICFFYYSGGPTFDAVDATPWYMVLLEGLLLI